MVAVFRELMNAVRGLKRAPGFTALAVLVLGVGLGSTIFMFGAIKGYILEPLPFADSHQLMHLERNHLERGQESLEVTQHDYLDWREQQRSFTDLSAFYTGTVNLSGAGADRPERFDGAFITGNAFNVLGENAAIGRTLVDRDSKVGEPDVVLLGHTLWLHRYGGDPDIVGRTVRVNSRDATVVGVMPEGFAFPLNQDVWVPLRIDTTKLDNREAGTTLEVFGRLKPGVTRQQAQAEFDTIATRLGETYPDTNQGFGAVVKPYTWEYVDPQTRATILTMFGAVMLVLIIACANTANLLLVRTTRRTREMAVRSAMGASRGRLIGRILSESLVLCLLAMGLGLVIGELAGEAMMRGLQSGDATIPFWVDTSLSWLTLGYAFMAALGATLLAGLLPAMRATRIEIGESLKDGSGGAVARSGRLSRALVVFEIALSCVLLVGAGLMLRTLVNLDNRDFGANTDDLLIGRIGLFEEQYPEGAAQHRFFDNLVTRLGSESGVASAAAATSLPGTYENYTWVEIPGREAEPDEFGRMPWSYWSVTTPGFFDLLEIPLLSGRLYDRRDRADTQPVVVVTRHFADEHWPGEDVVGRQVQLDPGNETEPLRTIIGVVDNVHLAETDDQPRGAVFVPMSQSPVRFAYAAIRTSGNPLTYGPMMRDTVLSLNPDIPVYWLQTLNYWIRMGGWTDRLIAINFQAFGAIALVLAAVGMYGVLAYSVAQRTREIGVRRALGADDSRILRSVAQQSFWQLGIGLVLGLALALGFAQLLSSMLVGVGAMDIATFAGVAVLLCLVTAVAATVPTWRALRVNPVEALRYE